MLHTIILFTRFCLLIQFSKKQHVNIKININLDMINYTEQMAMGSYVETSQKGPRYAFVR